MVNLAPEIVDMLEQPSCNKGSSNRPSKKCRTELFDAKMILSQTTNGKIAIQEIESQKILTPKNRRTLVHVLVGHLISTCGLNPSAYEKASLAQRVILALPCLKDCDGETGYEHFYMKGANKRPATGYLEEHLRYVRKKLLSRKKDTNIDQKKEEEVEPDEDSIDMFEEEEVSKMCEWLKQNNKPEDKVEDYMDKTCRHRQQYIKEHDIGEILQQFPALFNPSMFEKDFAKKYGPECANNLYKKWEEDGSICKDVIDYTEKMNASWRDVLGLESTDMDNLTKDERKNLGILMLPLAFETKSKGKGKGRCSLKESIASFIDMQLEMTNIPQYLEGINKTSRPQPFILALFSKSKLSPSQVFVILERMALEKTTLIEAVDACYKLTYVLNINYQPSCFAAWQFLQFVYSQSGSVMPPCVRAFRTYVANKPAAADDDPVDSEM